MPSAPLVLPAVAVPVRGAAASSTEERPTQNEEEPVAAAALTPISSGKEEWIRTFVSQTEAWRDGVVYPNSISLNFPEFSRRFRTIVRANLQHRQRMDEVICDAGHVRVALHAYETCASLESVRLRGAHRSGLAWGAGEVCEFVVAVFQRFELQAPSGELIHCVYQLFDPQCTDQLCPRDCVCLVDALLRLVFLADPGGCSPSRGKPLSEDYSPLSALPAPDSPYGAPRPCRRIDEAEELSVLTTCSTDLGAGTGGTGDAEPRLAVLKASIGKGGEELRVAHTWARYYQRHCRALALQQAWRGWRAGLCVERQNSAVRNARFAPCCQKCSEAMQWSDHAEGIYVKGWDCEHVETCGNNRVSAGDWRWFCQRCSADLCHTCGSTQDLSEQRLRRLRAQFMRVTAEREQLDGECLELSSRLQAAEDTIQTTTSELQRYQLPSEQNCLDTATDPVQQTKLNVLNLIHDVDPSIYPVGASTYTR